MSARVNEAERRYFEYWLNAPSARKMERAQELYNAARDFFRRQVRAEHPEWSEMRVVMAAAQRMHAADDPAQKLLKELEHGAG